VKNGRNEVRPTSDEPLTVGMERIPHSVAFSDGEKFFLAASKGALQRQFNYTQMTLLFRLLFAFCGILLPSFVGHNARIAPSLTCKIIRT
jgi:hypothetical protein